MSTNFSLTTSSPPVNVIQSINYLLATQPNIAAIANAGNVNLGNVVQVSSNNAIFSNVGIIGYVNAYMDIKYANSATGSSGFTSNSTLANYYGVYNSPTNSESSNPVDYQWTQVSGGFGTTKGLYYTTGGGNTISFYVGTTAPNSYYQPVPDNVPIVLATISKNLVTSNSIQPQAVTNVQIATATITNVQIAANTITANNIQANTITAAQIAAGTITADKLAANALVANTIVSSNATLDVASGPGFWFDGNTGSGYMGGNTIIGDSLTVGNNAVIGNNLTVGGLITGGSLNTNTVATTNIQPGAVTAFTTYTTRQGSKAIGLIPNSATLSLWPNYTRGVAITANTVGVNSNVNVVVNFSTTINSTGSPANNNIVELWKTLNTVASQSVNTVSYDTTFRRVTVLANALVGGASTQDIFVAISNPGVVQSNSISATSFTNQTSIIPADTTYYTVLGSYNNSPYVANIVAMGNTYVGPQGFTPYGVCYMPWGTGAYAGQRAILAVGAGAQMYRSFDYNYLGYAVAETNTLNNESQYAGIYLPYYQNDLYNVASQLRPGTLGNSASFTCVAVGSNATVLVDLNRQYDSTGNLVAGSSNWQSYTNLGSTISYNDVANNYLQSPNNRFMIVGDAGTVITYVSGGSLVNRTSNVSANINLRGVTYDSTHNNWLAVGDSGTIIYSSDGGVNWSNISSGTTRTLYSIAYGSKQDHWVAVGDGVTIVGQNNAIIGGDTQTWGNVFQSNSIQRVAYFGSYVNPWRTPTLGTQVAGQQAIGNTAISGTYVDSDGQNHSYFLVVGNFSGAPVNVTNPSIQITYQKR